MKVYVKFLSQIAEETREKKLKIIEILLVYVVVVVVVVASYNLVTSAPMLYHDLVQFQLVYVLDPSVFFVTVLKY